MNTQQSHCIFSINQRGTHPSLKRKPIAKSKIRSDNRDRREPSDRSDRCDNSNKGKVFTLVTKVTVISEGILVTIVIVVIYRQLIV